MIRLPSTHVAITAPLVASSTRYPGIPIGQSLLDGRRESIVIDHGFNDEIAGYQPAVDSLAGRNGLRIRDEIRLVHPGLYLGRVYLSRVFVFNFTLESAETERARLAAFRETGRIEEDCRVGTQRIVATD